MPDKNEARRRSATGSGSEPSASNPGGAPVHGPEGDKRDSQCEAVRIEGWPATLPHPISNASQGYNDPAADSLFVLIDVTTNRCTICKALVYNNTESRDDHLSRNGCHVA